MSRSRPQAFAHALENKKDRPHSQFAPKNRQVNLHRYVHIWKTADQVLLNPKIEALRKLNVTNWQNVEFVHKRWGPVLPLSLIYLVSALRPDTNGIFFWRR
jgi:hypothetical protein